MPACFRRSCNRVSRLAISLSTASDGSLGIRTLSDEIRSFTTEESPAANSSKLNEVKLGDPFEFRQRRLIVRLDGIRTMCSSSINGLLFKGIDQVML